MDRSRRRRVDVRRGPLGLYLQNLQKKLTPQHRTGGSRDMILAVIGLVTRLLDQPLAE